MSEQEQEILESSVSEIQVIGCLIKNPSLLRDEEKYKLTKDDFPNKFRKIVFAAVNNLYLKNGVFDIDAIAIDGFLSAYETQYAVFLTNQGIDWVNYAIETSQPHLFDLHYQRLKKLSLLRQLVKDGIDINEIYNPTELNTQAKAIQEERLEKMTLKDIMDVIDKRVVSIKDKFLGIYGSSTKHVGDKLHELKEKLKQKPAIGAPLQSEILNAITRGARLKKLYMRSAPTGVGKTRLSLGDAGNLAIDEMYDTEKMKWMKRECTEPVLFITTELETEEVQTPLLAFVTGITEEKILNGTYSDEEEKILDRGIEVLRRSNLWIEHLPNFDINDIVRTVQRHVFEHGIKYVFFDYVHISMKLLEQLGAQSKGIKLREDNVLLMFVDKLKSTCNLEDVFIYTSTQVNGDWKNMKDADQNLLRGAKAMADKIDFGCIALEPTKADIEGLKPILQRRIGHMPNLVLHIYKNRGNKLVRIKLWQYVDLGTCRTKDLFVTDRDYKLVTVEALKIMLETEEDEDSKTMKEVVVENERKEVSQIDF